MKRAAVFTLLCLMAGMTLTTVVEDSAEAAITTVRGSACGYVTNVGLFGGPQAKLGCEPQMGTGAAPASAATRSPSVTLPAEGSATAITAVDADGAKATYGPAAVFSGIWPDVAASAPPSGPISVSTQGTPAGGSVTSSVDFVLRNPPNPASPGGIGPGPVQADEAHATCTATENGVTGTTSFDNGILYTSTNPDGSAATQEPIPDNPPPNYTRNATIDHVGGHPTIVFNEQLVNADGSLTVNAYHMYLFGPVAVGEQIVGQVTCGTTPSPLSPNDTTPPTCGIPVLVLADPTTPGSPPVVPAQVHLGVFDSGGLASLSIPQVTNGTAQFGQPDSSEAYLRFVPGQTGPLTVSGTRASESDPMSITFVATDGAGNRTEVQVGVANVGGVAAPTARCTALEPTPGATTTTTIAGGTTTTTAAAGTTTSLVAGSGAPTTTAGLGAATATTVGVGDPTGQSLAAQAGGPIEGGALSRTGAPLQSLVVVALASLALGALVLAGGRRSPPKTRG